jgi:signal transduction histidine kinase
MPIAEPITLPAGALPAQDGTRSPAPAQASRPVFARRFERIVSLRTELLLNLATLATAALLLAITTIVLFDAVLATPSGLLLLTGMVTADVLVFLLFGYQLTGRLVLQPLDSVVGAADRIAGGEHGQRVPERGAPEFVRLARAINTMTDQLIAEQERVVRVEKMASLGRLAAGVAHEVGNPLGAINGYTHLLKRRLAQDEASLSMVRELEREASRVDRIMRGLLDYARPRRATGAATDVGDGIDRVTSLLREQGMFARLRLDCALDDELPQIRIDPHLLDQVLVNLLSNAAQATPAGGQVHVAARLTTLDEALGRGGRRAGEVPAMSMPREAALRVGAWRGGSAPESLVQLIVADTGSGIPAEDLERVFDPFFATKAPGEGTGLGLAIVARTIEDAGGIIFARPAREGGAAFVVLLPAAAEAAAGVRDATPGRPIT